MLIADLGISFPYRSNRPMVTISIQNEKGEWTKIDFVVDTGANVSAISYNTAKRIGLNTTIYTGIQLISGVIGSNTLLHMKDVTAQLNGVSLRLKLGISNKISDDINILSYKSILPKFLLAFTTDETALFLSER
ncbi:MAG: retroviral-like aspartic protease family protein [Magnetococcales bacterium]|nr:retroviral-like aspartic protease family protein [Nitrospirota bacterium]